MKVLVVSTISGYRTQLVDLLDDAVASGASIGFLAPLSQRKAAAYWQHVDAELAAGNRSLVLACEQDRIMGAVQISYASKKNARHRAEVEKLIVHTAYRQRGIAQQLLLEVEHQARVHQRTLLVLDTRSADVAANLYRKVGYQEVGEIPQFALSTEGQLESTTIFYKLL